MIRQLEELREEKRKMAVKIEKMEEEINNDKEMMSLKQKDIDKLSKLEKNVSQKMAKSQISDSSS